MKTTKIKLQKTLQAQGAIEYLLILGAAILVVAIVVVAVTNIIQQGQTQTNSSTSSQQKAVNDLWKIKADTVVLAKYANSGNYQTKIIFQSETNCTIRQALQSLHKTLGTNDIYLGGNDNTYCGILASGANDPATLPPICDGKIIVGQDYNFQVNNSGAQTTPANTVIWKAWCD